MVTYLDCPSRLLAIIVHTTLVVTTARNRHILRLFTLPSPLLLGADTRQTKCSHEDNERGRVKNCGGRA